MCDIYRGVERGIRRERAARRELLNLSGCVTFVRSNRHIYQFNHDLCKLSRDFLEFQNKKLLPESKSINYSKTTQNDKKSPERRLTNLSFLLIRLFSLFGFFTQMYFKYSRQKRKSPSKLTSSLPLPLPRKRNFIRLQSFFRTNSSYLERTN